MKRYDPGTGGGWQPTPPQELVLRAALVQNDDAIAAWHEWLEQSTPAAVDIGSFRMLPLIYANLTALGYQGPELERIQKQYRATWVRNNLLMARGARALLALHDAGISTMLLKASALIPLYYHDAGVRPTTDIDVMVPIAKDREALEVLDRVGWKTVDRALAEMSDPYRSRHYAHTLSNGEGLSLDLHRHLLYFETRTDADDSFWLGSIPLTFEGLKTRALNPADQLIHICAHGTPWNPVPPIRWIADAIVLLRSAEIDWVRVVAQAQEHQVILIMRNTLRYLLETFDAKIPPEPLRVLQGLVVTRAERVLYEIAVRHPSEHSTALKLWFHYDQYRRLARLYQQENRLLRFPAFLRDTWGLNEKREVPGYMVRFTTHRVARRLYPLFKSTPKE